MAIQVPILTGLYLLVRVSLRWIVSGLYALIRRKLWFFVMLVLIFLGPLEFIGDTILWSLKTLLTGSEAFEQAGRAVNLTGWQSAISLIGAGADMANCVIDLNTYLKVAGILWLLVTLQVAFVSARFIYTMLPGKAT